MNKVLIYKNAFDEEVKVKLITDKYIYTDRLYLGIVDIENDELYADLTVNLPTYSCDISSGYLDINNCRHVREFIEKYKLGEYAGVEVKSGFNKYPLYDFDIREIKKYCEIEI